MARFTLRRQKKRFGDVLVVPCFDEDRGRTHGDVDEAFSSSSSHVRTCDKNNAFARMATSSYRIVRTRMPCTPGPSVSLSPPRPCRHLRGSQGGEGPGPSLSPRAKGNDSLTRKESSANKGRGGYVLADHGGGALHPLCWGRSLGEIAGVRGEGVVSSRLRGVEGRLRQFAGGGRGRFIAGVALLASRGRLPANIAQGRGALGEIAACWRTARDSTGCDPAIQLARDDPRTILQDDSTG